MTRGKKTPKGNVSVQLDKDRLRLYGRFQGQPFYLYLGLPDSKINRSVAEAKANQITLDLATGNFDPTLEKYKPETRFAPEQGSLWELFDRYWNWKQKTESVTTERSAENYRNAIKLILRYREASDLPVSKVSEDFVYGFIKWAKQQVSHATLTTYIVLLKAIWHHAKIEPNPWNVTIKATKLKPESDPFTLEEVNKIINAFQEPRWSCYADFVEFLLYSGMRIGEVCGLKWENVNPNCTQIWVLECHTQGQTRPVKSQKRRKINLSPKLTQILIKRRSETTELTEYVFHSPNGKMSLDSKNFRNRAWVEVLKELQIPYRKPYCTRKTFISHALAKGENPVNIAKITGHDTRVLFKNYAGVIDNITLPEPF
ncbi:tyrosine-type recombinase/integrase [Pannus brasiliensis CCIBt3594]|uniref:Tyrosine-type recombinase/integrase n=1 Tax=Pannus brasiliensis CCIBt3594 TaxID=1427578 RepID=A0AAW9QZ65_9CHRO